MTEVTDEDREAARVVVMSTKHSFGREFTSPEWDRQIEIAAECHAVQRERADALEIELEKARYIEAHEGGKVLKVRAVDYLNALITHADALERVLARLHLNRNAKDSAVFLNAMDDAGALLSGANTASKRDDD